LGKAQRKAINSFRKRLKQRGMARLEVNVCKDDATLVRNVVRALASPEQEQSVRALLREHFGSRQVEGLKALLAAAPLEGINLSRERDFGRDVDL
jgi:ATP phosphoribosyltransferase regulatory subunit HisZ